MLPLIVIISYHTKITKSKKDNMARLHDSIFTQWFALVIETDDRKNHFVILDYTRHHETKWIT